ncbi:MAG: helix-turn-helix transcriptional regulator [Candidatus Omnitrophica bacterium]|nr:helix-turn-helix transcriptional regulator [Candidatus Omnitrophota bacterium]
MLPFGQTVFLWRTARGLTQAALAHRAGMPRPNLCAIERGRREASLSTLRALARELDVRPGTLVDGIAPLPQGEAAPSWSREALERVADAVVGRAKPPTAQERALAKTLEQVVRNRLGAARGTRRPLRKGRRAAQTAWLQLETAYPREVVKSVLQRVEDRLLRR